MGSSHSSQSDNNNSKNRNSNSKNNIGNIDKNNSTKYSKRNNNENYGSIESLKNILAENGKYGGRTRAEQARIDQLGDDMYFH